MNNHQKVKFVSDEFAKLLVLVNLSSESYHIDILEQITRMFFFLMNMRYRHNYQKMERIKEIETGIIKQIRKLRNVFDKDELARIQAESALSEFKSDSNL